VPYLHAMPPANARPTPRDGSVGSPAAGTYSDRGGPSRALRRRGSRLGRRQPAGAGGGLGEGPGDAAGEPREVDVARHVGRPRSDRTHHGDKRNEEDPCVTA
jgi:hypothetical protein